MQLGHAARYADRHGPELPGHAVLQGLRRGGCLAEAARPEPRRAPRDHRQDPPAPGHRRRRPVGAGAYRNYRAARGTQFVPEDEDGLEDLLQAAVRIGLEYRLDLMNSRAAALRRLAADPRHGQRPERHPQRHPDQQRLHRPYTTNPFAFLSQAKNFSLVLNAELPLVRMNERNNFRTALINYQRARRTLMTAEDNLKIQLRTRLACSAFSRTSATRSTSGTTS